MDSNGTYSVSPYRRRAKLTVVLYRDHVQKTEIYDQYAAVEEALGEAAMAEESELIPEWEITVKIPAPDTPSNYRYETRVRTHRDRGVAEQEVEMAFGYDVVPEKTKQVGYAEVL